MNNMDNFNDDMDHDAPWNVRFFTIKLLKLIVLCSLALIIHNIMFAYQMNIVSSNLFDAIDHTAGDVRTLIDNMDNMIQATKASKLQLVYRLTQEIHARYVDKTDYACNSSGGAIANESAVLISPLHNATNLIMEQIQEAGQCWAFQAEAQVTIKLSRSVLLTAVTYEHITLENLPTSDALKSAPRDFSVFALLRDSADPKPLGNFTYDVKGESRQRFVLKDAMMEPVNFVLIRVSNNHGHKRYTCMYRLRVHGIEEGRDKTD